jgi:diketogulonate reductase-like aldo/keto reductase
MQQPELLEYCATHDIEATAFGPLGSPEKARPPKVLDDELMAGIASSHGVTPAQVSLRFLLQLGNTSVVPKALLEDHLNQNLSLNFELSDHQMNQIKSLQRKERIFFFDYASGVTEHPEYPFHV